MGENASMQKGGGGGGGSTTHSPKLIAMLCSERIEPSIWFDMKSWKNPAQIESRERVSLRSVDTARIRIGEEMRDDPKKEGEKREKKTGERETYRARSSGQSCCRPVHRTGSLGSA